MKQLLHFSNFYTDVDLVKNDPDCLANLLHENNLDGMEMMFCAPWDKSLHKAEWIQGVHLNFWPSWLDFWRGNREITLQQYGSEKNVLSAFGGWGREDWLQLQRENLAIASKAEPKYMVFHVSHVLTPEVFNRRFSASDKEIVEATVEVVNELTDNMPPNVELLFENLWWPGLTLRDVELVVYLLESVEHPKVGLMLDTGHLMNFNPDLRTEEEGIDYILATLTNLGEYSRQVRGVHLHSSLSGEYVRHSMETHTLANYSPEQSMSHVLRIDQHLPFSTPSVRKILDYIKPDYLVHELAHDELADWRQKIRQQQEACFQAASKVKQEGIKI